MPLHPDDHQLSMRVSPRARSDVANEGLRSLLVHRLRPTPKAIWRWGLRDPDNSSVLCEPCGRWTRMNDEPKPTWHCPSCGRTFEAEFVIFSEVPPEDDDRE